MSNLNGSENKDARMALTSASDEGASQEEKDIPADVREKVLNFCDKVASDHFTFRVDATIKTADGWRKVKYAVQMQNLAYGISYETYQQYAEYIDAEINKALEEKERKKLQNSFTVRALAGELGAILADKQLPYDLYKQLKAENLIRYESREYLEEIDDFTSMPGWYWKDEAVERVRKYAERIATEKEKALAKQIVEERRRKEEEERRIEEEKAQLRQELQGLLATINQALEKKQRIKETDYSPKGEEIQHPLNPKNIYGGGEWFVIEQDRILHILNNGMDGDDWSLNNVRTGGAGAIGFEISKTDEVVNALRRIKEIGEKLQDETPTSYTAAMAKKISQVTGMEVGVEA
jgi:hypothetical protein